MALYSVGTPGIIRGFSLWISFNASIRSNFGIRIISMPWLMAKFITAVMAKTWKSGSTPSTRSPAKSPVVPPGGDLEQIAGDVGMGEHGAFRRARGAAGILQHGDVVVGEGRAPIVPVIGEQIFLAHDFVASLRGRDVGTLRAASELHGERFEAGSREAKRATTALSIVPPVSSGSSLSKVAARSSVIMILVPLSFA